MIFRQLFEHDTCTYTYLIADEKSQEAIFIDPVIDHLDSYLQLVKELGLELIVALDTHVHADHITATGNLRKKFNCSIAMGAHTKAEFVTERMHEGDILRIGSLKLKALYTPGHTDDSYSFLMDDRVFTGDTLLIRGTGRTDFQNGSALAQYDSLFNKLLKLPENTWVYPAHDYKGWNRSTIGEEKRFNPRLQVDCEEDYLEIMDNLKLDRPRYIDIAVPANLKCGLK